MEKKPSKKEGTSVNPQTSQVVDHLPQYDSEMSELDNLAPLIDEGLGTLAQTTSNDSTLNSVVASTNPLPADFIANF